MAHRFRLCLACLTFWVFLPPLAQSQMPGSGPHDRVKGNIVDADVTTLLDNTHPLARPEFDRGVIGGDTQLERMVLILKPDAVQQRELDMLTEAQQDPFSPQFHQWLTPQEYGMRFGASVNDLARMTGWLQGHGFQVEPVPAGHRSVLFSGTAAQVADAFHAEIHRYQVQGQTHFANAQDPQIPRAFAPVVSGLLSLHNFRRNPSNHSVEALPRPENTQGGAHYLLPADFATIYNLTALDKAGLKGNGTSIAIVGRSNVNLSDVAAFRAYAGLPANLPKVILSGKNPGLVPGDQDEATLDVEWAGGVSPAATIQYVAAQSTATTDGVDLAAQYIVNNKTASVMSTSFGSCEANMGSAEMAFYNGLWQQAAVEGITAFVSSGDSGASGCDGGNASQGSGVGVNGLCSSPYAVCVGGTQFNEGSAASTYWSTANGSGNGSALSYIPEKVWNESTLSGGHGLWASGGGISAVYPQPSWQKGVSGAVSNGMRSVPDVSLTSAGHDGFLVYLNGSWYVFAGTSASSPSFAGMLSRMLQSQGGKGQGNINPILYGLLRASANPFHATPSGSNSVPGVTGYTASGAAYNLATGLGSVDAGILRTVWPSPGLPQSFILRTSAAAFSLQPGKSTTFAVSLSPSGGFSGAVSLSAKLPQGVSLIFNPASIQGTSTSTATLSVTAGTAIPASSLSIGITGVSGTLQSTTSIALTILAPPTLALSAGVGRINLVQGRTTTTPVSIGSGGSYSGAVSLTISGLPSGVTAAWSANNFPLTGASNKTVTLTLKAASSVTVASSAFQINAAGDGLQVQTSASLQILPAPAIQLALTPSQVILPSTATQQFFGTITLVGGVTPGLNAVTFQVAGLPPGVSASSSVHYTPGSSLVQATFTLTGGPKAASTKTVLSVTAKVIDAATGQTYTGTQQVNLSVVKATQIGPGTPR